MAHILSYLDPISLMQSESVSRAWNEQASSRHVWRIVFRRAYAYHRSERMTSKTNPSNGLGKALPNQNWKRMFLVRRALEQRWRDGKAAAIYLHGHKDSVYCAQFDEYVDSTFQWLHSFLTVLGTKSSPVLVTALFAFGMRTILGSAGRLSVHPLEMFQVLAQSIILLSTLPANLLSLRSARRPLSRLK